MTSDEYQTTTIRNCTVDITDIHPNLNSSNTYGSFTMASSNSFVGPYEILEAPENKHLGIFIIIILWWNCVSSVLIEAILMSTLNIPGDVLMLQPAVYIFLDKFVSLEV